MDGRLPKKENLESLAILGGLGKKEGGWYPNAHYLDQMILV